MVARAKKLLYLGLDSSLGDTLCEEPSGGSELVAANVYTILYFDNKLFIK